VQQAGGVVDQGGQGPRQLVVPDHSYDAAVMQQACLQ
jgi:hypothetical protein